MSRIELVNLLNSPAVQSPEIARAGMTALARRLDRLMDLPSIREATLGAAGVRGSTACLHVLNQHPGDVELVGAAISTLEMHYSHDTDDGTIAALLAEGAIGTLLALLGAALAATGGRSAESASRRSQQSSVEQMMRKIGGSRAIKALMAAKTSMESLSHAELLAVRDNPSNIAAFAAAAGFDIDADSDSESDGSDDVGFVDAIVSAVGVLDHFTSPESSTHAQAIDEMISAGGVRLVAAAIAARASDHSTVSSACRMLGSLAARCDSGKLLELATCATPALLSALLLDCKREPDELEELLLALHAVLSLPPCEESFRLVDAELPRLVRIFFDALVSASASVKMAEGVSVASASASVLVSVERHLCGRRPEALSQLLLGRVGGARMVVAAIRIFSRSSAPKTAEFCALLATFLVPRSDAACHEVVGGDAIPALLAALRLHGEVSAAVVVGAVSALLRVRCSCCAATFAKVTAGGETARLAGRLQDRWRLGDARVLPLLETLVASL